MRRNLIICLLLVVTTITVYGQVMRFEFVNYDDQRFVTENEHVQEGLTARGIAWAFTGHVDYWRPVSMLSHMLDCQLYGLKPAGHHLTNLVLHLINTLLLFGLLKSMTRALWPSAAVAALFCLHPLHVEAVAWVAERKEVLSATFALLSAWAYVAYTRRGGVGRYLLTALFLAMGLMAKPMVVALPALFVLLDYWPLERIRIGPTPAGRPDPRRPIAALLVEKIPLFVLCAASSVLTILNQKQVGTLASVAEVPMHLRGANALVSYVRYLGKTIWPKDLSVLYPHPNLPGGIPWQPWQVVGAGLVLLFISALVIVAARRRYLLVGWLWYLGTLVPVIGLAQVGMQAIADRYTYVPQIGLFIIMAWGGTEVVSGAAHRYGLHRLVTTLGRVGAVAVLIACAACSWSQLRHWRSSQTLFEQALRATPRNPIMLYNLAETLGFSGEYRKAIDYFGRALELDPEFESAHINLGMMLILTGRPDEALAHFREAVRLNPDSVEAYVNLGNVHKNQGNLEAAVNQYHAALRAEPDSTPAHFNLATTLMSLHRFDEAIDHYRRVLEANPDLFDAHRNIGLALAALGRIDEAISPHRRALELRPGVAEAHYELARVLTVTGTTNEALTHFLEAGRLKPAWPPALHGAARILATHPDPSTRDPSRALELAGRAAKLTRRQDPLILDTLAAAYAAAGRFKQASETAEAALALATTAGAEALADTIRKRLERYRRTTADSQFSPGPRPHQP